MLSNIAALGERERAVDTMSAERKKDSEKWERERETHRQKMEDLLSHFAREREREEEREDQRDRERCASEEALKAAVDKGRNAREERDKGFREMEELMKEREKERGLHRGQLENMAEQVDTLSGLVRKVEEERDEAMCALQHQALASVEQAMHNLRIITLNLDRDFDTWQPEDAQSLANTVAKAAGVAKEHVKILDCQRGSVIASTIILAPDWSAASTKLETSLMDESAPLKGMGVVGCAGLLGGVIGKAPLPAAFAAASVAAAAREEEYNASICRAEHMLSALDSVLAQKLSHRLQELASARADAAVTHERVLKEWVDGKRDMMALQGAHERLLRDHDAAEEKRTEVNEMLKKERTEVDIAQALLAEEKEFTNQIASERDSIAKILFELLSLLRQCENERQTSETLMMQELEGKLQEVNLLTNKLNTVKSALVLAQQGAQERESGAADLHAQLARRDCQMADLEKTITIVAHQRAHLQNVLDTSRKQAAEVCVDLLYCMFLYSMFL